MQSVMGGGEGTWRVITGPEDKARRVLGSSPLVADYAQYRETAEIERGPAMATFVGSASFLPRRVWRKKTVGSQQEPPPKGRKRTGGESTDWIASSLSRRFGVGAGLAWAGFLAVGVVSEQIKTRLEANEQEAGTREIEEEVEIELPGGIRYREMRVGGGAAPATGDLVVVGLRGSVKGSGEVFVDTFGEGGKPLALVLGSKPYTKGMCEGVAVALRRMRAGGRARVVVPPELGFGDGGAELGGGVLVPPSSTLEFVVQLDRVSIAPA
ncbi:peptidyl-prolyl cis-trans isomerase FKBP17-2, chloroplastic-like [Wolffia australiana]